MDVGSNPAQVEMLEVKNTTNQIIEPFDLKPKQRQKENDRVDSILKDMFQLVEQKAMEDERERIIDIINNITSLYVSLPTEKVEEMIYKDDIINKITNSK